MLLRSLLILTALLCAPLARGCSIPVFRYALDRWQADPYQLEVSTSDGADEVVARFLRNFTDSTPINFTIVRTKADSPSRLVFPHAEPGARPAWNGRLAEGGLARITDSLARTALVQRIMEGEVGVWVLVESGDDASDDRLAAALEKRLRYLEQVAQLPQIDPSDPTSKLGPGPALRVKFSLLRVKRDDAEEQPFLKMLAGPKSAEPPATGPWLALVFGRGRVLGAWPAEGFGDEQIDETCLFLLGACSCEVKRMNPGWDLLLNHDWNESLRALGFPSLEAEGAEGPRPTPETVTFTAAPPPPPPPPAAATSPSTITGAAVAGSLLLLGIALVWRTIRGHP